MTQIANLGSRFSINGGYSLGAMRAGFSPRKPAAQNQWQPMRGGSDGPVVVQVRVDNLLLDALLDTGATRTVISRTLAGRLGLAPQGRARLAGLTADLDCDRTAPIRISVGPTELPPIIAIVLDLAAMSGAIRTPFDLILGQDMFLRHEIELDFENGRFRIGGDGLHVGSRLALHQMDDGLFATEVQAAGATGLAAIDLGSMLPLYISSDFATRHGLADADRTSTSVTIGIEGPSVHTTGRLASLSFAGRVFHDIPFAVPERWNLYAPIVLGLPLLSRFDMRLRFGERWATFRARAGNAAFPRDRSGLNVVAGGGGLEVIHVARNSPAERLGIVDGDVIVAVDGRVIDAHFLSTCKGLGTAPVGTNYRLELLDGRRATLTLDDYY